MKHTIKSIRSGVRKTKEAVVAEYRRDPEVFMQTLMYSIAAAGFALGSGVKIANGLASYRSKTAYAKIMNNSMKGRS